MREKDLKDEQGFANIGGAGDTGNECFGASLTMCLLTCIQVYDFIYFFTFIPVYSSKQVK